MKRQAVVKGILIGVLTLLFASCGKDAAGTLEKMMPAGAEGEVQAVEQQPYERYRNATEETEEIVESEEEQVSELKEYFEKLTLQYVESDDAACWVALSPNCGEIEASGKSCIAPFLLIYSPTLDPILCVGFNRIGDDYLEMDAMEVHTDEYIYTYGAFDYDVQKDKITLSSDQSEKTEELGLKFAMDGETDLLVDMLADIPESETVTLRFEKFDTAKPEWDECEMPEADRQAIIDVLNAYYLYLNASNMARAKAIAAFE